MGCLSVVCKLEVMEGKRKDAMTWRGVGVSLCRMWPRGFLALSTMPTYAQPFPSPDSRAGQCGAQSKVGVGELPLVLLSHPKFHS